MEKTIRVVLADDHPVVRSGIKSIIAADSDLEVIGEATNGEEVRQVCECLQPDVLLLDMQMPRSSPAETVTYLSEHCPHTKVLVLTGYDSDFYVRGVIAAGAAGYVLKDEAPEAVVRAIRAVMNGDTWYSQPIVEKLAQWQAEETTLKKDIVLTEREREILDLLIQGCSNRIIADMLGFGEQTVRNYASRIYSKVGVQSRAELIVWAHDQGLMDH